MVAFLAKGGVLVIPILFCSVVALAIFFERLIRFARMRKRGDGLELRVAEKLNDHDDREAREIAGSSDSPMGRALAQVLEVKDLIGKKKDKLVVIRADRAVILNKAVKVMDVAKAAGAGRLCLATEKDF